MNRAFIITAVYFCFAFSARAMADESVREQVASRALDALAKQPHTNEVSIKAASITKKTRLVQIKGGPGEERHTDQRTTLAATVTIVSDLGEEAVCSLFFFDEKDDADGFFERAKQLFPDPTHEDLAQLGDRGVRFHLSERKEGMGTLVFQRRMVVIQVNSKTRNLGMSAARLLDGVIMNALK